MWQSRYVTRTGPNHAVVSCRFTAGEERVGDCGALRRTLVDELLWPVGDIESAGPAPTP